jgi:hypothetical protein
MNNEDRNFWFILSVMANIAQLESWQMNKSQVNNGQILEYLQHQDTDLLQIIIEQNKEIIKLLKGDSTNAQNLHR